MIALQSTACSSNWPAGSVPCSVEMIPLNSPATPRMRSTRRCAPRRRVRLPLFQKGTGARTVTVGEFAVAMKKSCTSSVSSSAPARWKAARGKLWKPTFACSRANPPTASTPFFPRLRDELRAQLRRRRAFCASRTARLRQATRRARRWSARCEKCRTRSWSIRRCFTPSRSKRLRVVVE